MKHRLHAGMYEITNKSQQLGRYCCHIHTQKLVYTKIPYQWMSPLEVMTACNKRQNDCQKGQPTAFDMF